MFRLSLLQENNSNAVKQLIINFIQLVVIKSNPVIDFYAIDKKYSKARYE